MVAKPQRFSWKGREPDIWKGMTRLTPASQGEGRLRMIKNGYISPDGTEIRQMPGFKCVINLEKTGFPATAGFPTTDTGYTREVIDFQDDHKSPPQVSKSFTRPVTLHAFEECRGKVVIIGESDFKKWYVTDASGTNLTIQATTPVNGETILTFTGIPSASIVNSLTGGTTLYVQSTGRSELDDQFHVVTAIGSALITVGTSTAASTTGITGHAYATRSENPLQEPDALTIYTVERKPSHGTPEPQCRPATVANRLRDWGTSRGPSYIQPQSMASFPFEGWAQTEYHGIPRRQQKKIPFKVVPHVSGDRILMAVRGYGVIFQAPVVIPPSDDTLFGISTLRHNHIYDKPRALGLPKAVMLDPTDKTGLHPAAAAPYAETQAAGTYRLQVRYFDSGTQEAGLASEQVTIVVGATERIRLYVLHPGYLLGECMPDTIDIYASKVGGSSVGFLTSVRVPLYGVIGRKTPDTFADLLYEINLTGFTDSEVDLTRVPDTDVQMPMGSHAVRTIRGVTLFGGSVGKFPGNIDETDGLGSLEAGEITYNPTTGASAADWNKEDEILIQLLSGVAAKIQDPWNVAGAMLPPAFVGLELFSDKAFPEEVRVVLLNIMKNMDATISGGVYLAPNKWFPRFSLLDKPTITGTWKTFTSAVIAANLFLARGLYWFSEQGEPPRVPGTNQGFLDSDTNDDIEGIGRYRNYAILLSRRQTFRLQWGQNLRQENPPQVMDPREGCISANSVIEADDFLGWMSDRGPYAINGGATDWIGRPLKPYFEGDSPRYKRDLKGLMLHSWSAYDTERGLVFFGVRTLDGGFDLDTEGEKSKYACDEVLIYNINADAWSIWVPPLEIVWMRRLLHSDGVSRMCFLADDNRIYALGDDWADSNTTPVTASANAAATASATFVSGTIAFNWTADPFKDGNQTRVGMNYVLYKGIDWPTADQGQLIGQGTISAIVSTTTLTLDQSLTWKKNDTIEVGVLPPMEIETNSEAFGLGTPKKIKALNLRYSFFKDNKAWSEVTSDSSKASAPVNLQFGKDEVFNRMEFVAAFNAEKVTQDRLSRGATRGDENNFIVKIYGGPQVRIQDIVTEVDEA